MAQSWLTVANIPPWIHPDQLLGEGGWKNISEDAGCPIYEARVEQVKAALIRARLRGVVIDGKPIEVKISPKLKRSQEKAGALEEARLRRNVTVGFKKKGAILDKEGHFSLTPEDIALSLAREFGKGYVVDACCGAGGNAIAFARTECRVKAFELSEERIRDAKHNAKLYQCESQIEFIRADSTESIEDESGDLLWIDPPWGDYDKFDCKLTDFPLLEKILRESTFKNFKQIWVKLPPSFRCENLPEFEPRAIFGLTSGDRNRVKFLLLRFSCSK